MPSARSIAISKLSEAASKLIFVPIKIKNQKFWDYNPKTIDFFVAFGI